MSGAYIDAQCEKCKRRFGWFGTVLDQPACPSCGNEPDREKLAADHKYFEELRKILLECRRKRGRKGAQPDRQGPKEGGPEVPPKGDG